MRNYLIVINPHAGNKRFAKKAEQICSAIHQKGWHYHIILSKLKGFDEHLNYHLNLLIYTDVIIVGGDGTLNKVINTVRDKLLVLSVITAGTGNDSMKTLAPGVTRFEDQVSLALSDNIKMVDAASCNGHWFVNGVGLGFDGRVVEKMEEKGNGKTKLGYLTTVLRILLGFNEKPISLTIDGKRIQQPVFLLTIANGTTFGNGFKITPKAKFDDGLLDVCLIRKINPFFRLLNLSRLSSGSHIKLPFVDYIKAREIIIDENKLMVAHMDGELIGNPPFKINVIPSALRMRLP